MPLVNCIPMLVLFPADVKMGLSVRPSVEDMSGNFVGAAFRHFSYLLDAEDAHVAWKYRQCLFIFIFFTTTTEPPP